VATGALILLPFMIISAGLHVALNMKQDCPNEWHLFKKNGAVDFKIDKARLPYMAQTLDAAIENVLFLARVNSPAGCTIKLDNNELNLAWMDEWQLCRGSSKDNVADSPFSIVLGVPFELSADDNNIEDLMMVVKYVF